MGAGENANGGAKGALGEAMALGLQTSGAESGKENMKEAEGEERPTDAFEGCCERQA